MSREEAEAWLKKNGKATAARDTGRSPSKPRVPAARKPAVKKSADKPKKEVHTRVKNPPAKTKKTKKQKDTAFDSDEFTDDSASPGEEEDDDEYEEVMPAKSKRQSNKSGREKRETPVGDTLDKPGPQVPAPVRATTVAAAVNGNADADQVPEVQGMAPGMLPRSAAQGSFVQVGDKRKWKMSTIEGEGENSGPPAQPAHRENSKGSDGGDSSPEGSADEPPLNADKQAVEADEESSDDDMPLAQRAPRKVAA